MQLEARVINLEASNKTLKQHFNNLYKNDEFLLTAIDGAYAAYGFLGKDKYTLPQLMVPINTRKAWLDSVRISEQYPEMIFERIVVE
jgi:hypothetical protein